MYQTLIRFYAVLQDNAISSNARRNYFRNLSLVRSSMPTPSMSLDLLRDVTVIALIPLSHNLSSNNVALQLRLLRVLPPSRATNFHFAKSRRRLYFLQHETEFVARGGGNTCNDLNLTS